MGASSRRKVGAHYAPDPLGVNRTAVASDFPEARPATTLSPHAEIGIQEELEVGVGEYDRPDIAAIHDDPRPGGHRALQGH